MRSLICLVALLLAAPAFAQAPLPLAINVGASANDKTGDGLRTAFLKTMASVNALHAARGAANGIATLGMDGRLTPAQLSQSFDLSGIAPLNTRYAAIKNPNAVMVGPGNSISFCPELSCVTDPSSDHQRASLLVSAVTQDDGHSEEQTVGITTTVRTGYARPWAPSTAFAVGDNVQFDAPRNTVYRAIQGGTSASAGTGPVGKGNSIADGSVVWAWINDQAINAKVGLYNEVKNVAGGGASWAQANNFELSPGHIPTFNINTELDFSNNSGLDCVPSVANCNGLYMQIGGTNKSTAGIAVTSTNTGNFGALWGARLSGDWLASEATLEIDTKGQAGIGIGTFTPSTYTVAAINDASTAPASLNLTGIKSLAGIREATTSPVGLRLQGTYSQGQIVGTGFSIAPNGDASVQSLGVSGNLFEISPVVPSSASAACTRGQRSWDVNYEYRCVATNRWRRTAFSADWP